jgi:protocatechuate 3,4-dioxygenase beta subunit
MTCRDSLHDRRTLLKRLGLGLGALYFFDVPGAFAQELVLTPSQMIGPFYPDTMPLDRDNDLLIINDAITPAVGDITWLSGRVLDARGKPVRGATVEIWQTDNNGAYIHSKSDNRDRRDGNFQGFGRFLTASSGEYAFRTIKPTTYPGRTRHIHFLIKVPGQSDFSTQMYVEGEPQNTTDQLLNSIRDESARRSVIVPFVPVPESRVGELTARFDIVLGLTPAL